MVAADGVVGDVAGERRVSPADLHTSCLLLFLSLFAPAPEDRSGHADWLVEKPEIFRCALLSVYL